MCVSSEHLYTYSCSTLANVLSEWLIRFVNKCDKKRTWYALSKRKNTWRQPVVFFLFHRTLSKSIVPLKVSVKNIVIVSLLSLSALMTLRRSCNGTIRDEYDSSMRSYFEFDDNPQAIIMLPDRGWTLAQEMCRHFLLKRLTAMRGSKADHVGHFYTKTYPVNKPDTKRGNLSVRLLSVQLSSPVMDW